MNSNNQTGGPGCSSQLALFAENGPCSVNENGDGTVPKEFSWTNKANVIWVSMEDFFVNLGYSLTLGREGLASPPLFRLRHVC